VFVWSVDPRDYSQPGTQEIVRRVLGEAHPGVIVLLHDGSPDGRDSREQTLEALPAIIEGLRGQGYRFVRLGPPVATAAAQRSHEALRLTPRVSGDS
jgi:peptidoglycan/xylan/chitin deacetylase (PgdA/CDA1 family)